MSLGTRSRLEWQDWLLLAAMVPVWMLCLGDTVWSGLKDPAERIAFSLTPAPADGYPLVVGTFGPMSEASVARSIRVGDAIVSIDGVDLRGATLSQSYAVANRAFRSTTRPEVVYRRGETIARTVLPLVPNAHPLPGSRVGLTWI